MRLQDDVRYRRSPDALFRRVGVDVLVTRPGDPRMDALSGGATAVWNSLIVASTLEELVDRLAAEHGVEEEQIRREVESCLDTLLELGVVEPRTAANA